MKKSRLGFVFLLLAACGPESKTTEQTPAFESADRHVIGGFATAGYEAVGTVGIVAEGKYYMLCSAVLVAEQTALTAKHCAIFTPDAFTPAEYWYQPLTWGYPLAFATGNAVAPTQLFDVADIETAPETLGGYSGLGSDVAALHLVQRAKDIKTLAFATEGITTGLLDKKAVVIGYGSQTHLANLTGELDGSRKAGASTIAAIDGNVFALGLGSREAFDQWVKRQYGEVAFTQCLASSACKAELDEWYQSGALLPEYEAWVAAKEGDAVACHGDDGGPLLQKVKKADGTSEMTVIGLVSGGIGSEWLTCDYGSVYATFGGTTQQFLRNAAEWTDPCEVSAGLTISAQGSCDGTVATRCTTATEGSRRLVVLDCALADQTCDIVDGLAACVDGNGDATTNPEVDSKPNLPTPNVLQGIVERASTGVYGSAARRLLKAL
jgi:hypothetical protein